MARLVIAALISLALMGFGAWSVVVEWVLRPNAPFSGDCERWLDRPEQKWVVLTGCVLDVEAAVLESEAGEFESLKNRKQGLATKLYPVTPTWAAAWVPVRTPGGAGIIRAAFRVESKDLMKWLNGLEQLDEAQREKQWADPVLLRRIVKPGVLSGRAQKPAGDGLQKAWSTNASSGLLAVLPGTPPPPAVPTEGLVTFVLGLMMGGVVLRMATGAPRLAGETTEQYITAIHTGDVKPQLGDLEALRREERRKR